MAENTASVGTLEKLFKLSQKGTNVKTELIAGITTFVAVAYIIFVNPTFLQAAGIPLNAAVAATIWSAIFATTLMGLWANYPVAVAPGMGLNAFFTYTVVLQIGKAQGFGWEVALGAVFISGIVFLILTLGGIRQAIIKSVPVNLKTAIGAGIGIFIAFIGLQNSGIVVADVNTMVTAGKIANLDFAIDAKAPLLTFAGLIITTVMIRLGIKGAILLGIIITSALGMLVGAGPLPEDFSSIFSTNIPSIFGPEGTFMKMDIMGALKVGIFSIIFTMTIVELFDNMGTLIGVTKKAKLMKSDGSIENLDKALTTDAIGTMASAIMGTSTVTSYVESAAGVAEGGRTGLTALVVALLFFVALFFAPLVGLVQSYATAPALIIVGAMMMSEVRNINFDDITESIPVFLTIIIMPLTYSIANGFAFGFVSYTLLKLFSFRFKELSLVMLLVSIAFVVNFILRLH